MMNTESVTRCPNCQAIAPLEALPRLCTKRLPTSAVAPTEAGWLTEAPPVSALLGSCLARLSHPGKKAKLLTD